MKSVILAMVLSVCGAAYAFAGCPQNVCQQNVVQRQVVEFVEVPTVQFVKQYVVVQQVQQVQKVQQKQVRQRSLTIQRVRVR